MKKFFKKLLSGPFLIVAGLIILVLLFNLYINYEKHKTEAAMASMKKELERRGIKPE